MNILPGRVEGPGRVSLAGRTVAVEDMKEGLTPGTAVDVGLRPEDVRPAPDGSLKLAVDFVEELGATQLFHGQMSGAEFVLQSQTGTIPADAREITAAVDPAQVHLFDPETSRRLGRE